MQVGITEALGHMSDIPHTAHQQALGPGSAQAMRFFSGLLEDCLPNIFGRDTNFL